MWPWLRLQGGWERNATYCNVFTLNYPLNCRTIKSHMICSPSALHQPDCEFQLLTHLSDSKLNDNLRSGGNFVYPKYYLNRSRRVGTVRSSNTSVTTLLIDIIARLAWPLWKFKNINHMICKRNWLLNVPSIIIKKFEMHIYFHFTLFCAFIS